MRSAVVWLAVAVTSMVVMAFILPLALLVQDLAHDRAIVRLEREAQTLATAIAILQPESADEVDQIRNQSLGLQPMTVVLPDGAVSGPDPASQRLVLQVRLSAQTERGEIDGGEAVAVPVIVGESAFVVTTFATDAELSENVARAWVVLAGLAVISILLAGLIAARLGNNVVTAVKELSSAARALSRGQLHARVTPAGPREIAETGTAFNLMAERISGLIRGEREQVANLSHRLRTPLTSLELNVDQVTDEATRNRLIDDLDEMKRTVDAVIKQARRPIRQGAGVSSNLGQIVKDRVGFWSPLAEEQGRQWKVKVDPSVMVSVPESDVVAVIDALLTNVFAHTDEGTAFAVRVTDKGVLEVHDAGQGFPAAFVERGVSGGGSTGLGLDIVRQTAEAEGGSITVGTSPLGGANISVVFTPES